MTMQQAVRVLLTAIDAAGRYLSVVHLPRLVKLLVAENAAPCADREAEDARALRIGTWMEAHSVPLPMVLVRRERLH